MTRKSIICKDMFAYGQIAAAAIFRLPVTFKSLRIVGFGKGLCTRCTGECGANLARTD